MSVSQSDVNAWFAANPNATQNDVAAAVQSIGGLEANPGLAGMLASVYQSTPENVSNYYNNYTGTTANPASQALTTSTPQTNQSGSTRLNSPANSITQADVNAWFAANPNATEYDVAAAVKGLGGLEANPGLAVLLSNVYQSTPQNISNYYNNYTKDVSNTQAAVDKFFADNPNATPSDVAQAVANMGGLNSRPGLTEAIAKKYSNTPQQITDSYTNYITQKVAPPTFNDVYQPWLSSYQQKFGKMDINRPWNADQDSINQKAALDKAYIDKINQYNQQFGTNLKPDASVLGANAQPNSFTVEKTSGPGPLGWLSDTVHHIGTTIAKSPILNTAAVATLTYFGVPPSVAAGIVSTNAGAKPETIVLNMIAAGIAPEIAKQVAPQISSLTGSNLAGQVAGQAAGSATGAVITGRDPLQAGLSSLVSGGANIAAGQLATEIPGWSDIGPLQQKAIISTMSATMQGKDPTTALVQSALDVGKQVASDYAKQAISSTKMALTNGFDFTDSQQKDLATTAFVDAKSLGATDQEAKAVADSVAGTTNTASGDVGSISQVVVAPDVQVAGNYMPEIPQPKAGQLMVDSTGRPISIGVISYDSSGKGQLVAAPITGDQTSGYSYEVNGKPQSLTQEQYERLFYKTNPSDYLKISEKMYAKSGDLDAFNKAFGVKEPAAKPVTTIDVEAKEVPAAKSSKSLFNDIISKVGGLDAVEIGGALTIPEVADLAKNAMSKGYAQDIFDELSKYENRRDDDEHTRYLNELYKSMTGDYVPGTVSYNYAHRSELKPVEVTPRPVAQVYADTLDDSFVFKSLEDVSTNTNQDINQTVIDAANSGANPATVAQEVSKADPNINVETSVDPQTGATSVTTTNANNNTVTATQTDGKTQTTTNVNNDTGITTSTSSGGSGGTITTTVTDTVSGGGAVITKDPVTDKIVAVETTGKNVQVIDSNTVVIDDKKIDVSTGTVVSTPTTTTTTPTTTTKTTPTTAKAATPSTATQPSFFGLSDAGQAIGAMSFLGPQFLKTKENQKQFIDPLSLYRNVASAEGIPMQQISPQMPSDSLDKYYNYGKAESIDDILGLGKKDDESRDSSASQSAIDNLLNVPYAAKDGGLVTPLMAAGGSVKAQKYAQGGLSVPLMNHGGKMRGDFRHGAHVAGPGDGQSDDIPAMLADGEYVLDSEIVAALGNGSTKAGSKLLDKFRQEIRTHKRSGSINSIPPKSKSPLQYLSDAKKKLDKK
jgi:hypothetical protein